MKNEKHVALALWSITALLLILIFARIEIINSKENRVIKTNWLKMPWEKTDET